MFNGPAPTISVCRFRWPGNSGQLSILREQVREEHRKRDIEGEMKTVPDMGVSSGEFAHPFIFHIIPLVYKGEGEVSYFKEDSYKCSEQSRLQSTV